MLSAEIRAEGVRGVPCCELFKGKAASRSSLEVKVHFECNIRNSCTFQGRCARRVHVVARLVRVDRICSLDAWMMWRGRSVALIPHLVVLVLANTQLLTQI